MSDCTPIRITDARPVPGFRRLGEDALSARSSAAAPEETPEDSYAQGYGQGSRDAEQRFEAERGRLNALIAACEALQPEPSEELALLIAHSVEALVRITVGETKIDRDKLLTRARGAAALIADANSARTLHLNPDDIALIDSASLPLVVVADPSLAPGTVRVDDSKGWIEDGVAIHLDALREQLGLKELGR
ncbi:MAG TPA: flagellar biosynthetic protein [Sphingomicrobium sp.]|nr:flagellar biosynthetic protein [Sphingomicrobium sp.]